MTSGQKIGARWISSRKSCLPEKLGFGQLWPENLVSVKFGRKSGFGQFCEENLLLAVLAENLGLMHSGEQICFTSEQTP